jgi:hypothetical protein
MPDTFADSTIPINRPALPPTLALTSTPDDEALLWRYMSFVRFISLLSSRQLYFARADQFVDQFEGTYGGLNAKRRIDHWGEPYATQLITRKRKEARYLTRRTYLNCWHENETESAAMWDSYGKNGESIAIVLPFRALRAVLPSEVAIRKVKYADLKTTFVSEGSSTDPFLYKRLSFQHEKEVRAILQEQPEIHSEEDLEAELPNKGICIGEGILSAIMRVHVAPRAPDSFLDVVSNVSAKYGLSVAPQRSELDDGPVF